MVVRQGDLYWLDLGRPVGSEPGFRHPFVVIQSDVLNESRLATTVVCLLTSNTALGGMPGNVRLEKGEAHLPRASAVNVTQIFTVSKSRLKQRIGRLPESRVVDILRGVAIILAPPQ